METTDYHSDGLTLRLVGPPADLAPYLSAYYRTEVAAGVEVEDWLPPEEANLRTGSASVYKAAIGGDPVGDVPSSVISGPTDRATYLRISGGSFWGIGLTPAGWARFIRMPAHEMANSFTDASQTAIDRSIADMLDRLRETGGDIPASVDLINTTFRALPNHASPADNTIDAVHKYLLSEEATSVATVAEVAEMNPRTLERFCKRHFGFTPSALLRRQRFLRSLGQYMLDPTMSWISSLDTITGIRRISSGISVPR